MQKRRFQKRYRRLRFDIAKLRMGYSSGRFLKLLRCRRLGRDPAGQGCRLPPFGWSRPIFMRARKHLIAHNISQRDLI